MSMKTQITVNLPAYGAGQLPNPNKPVIEVDGVAIDGIIAVDFHLDCREEKQSTVTVTFHPKGVDGKFVVSADGYAVEKLTLGGGNENRD